MSALVFDLSLGEKTIHKEWQFKDLFTQDFSVDEKNRNIKVALDIRAIQNSINNMFLFTKGERIIRPDFGNSLYEFLYEPINEMTAQKLGAAILKMFEDWEPRVTIGSITVTPIPDENTFYVEIIYSIPALGNQTLSFATAINQRRQ